MHEKELKMINLSIQNAWTHHEGMKHEGEWHNLYSKQIEH